jgi:uncharacterized OsmC-like protein
MSTSNVIEQTPKLTNGLDVGRIMNVIGAIQADPGYAKFQFRATNQWIDGGLARSRIKELFAGNAEDDTREDAFMLDGDEPRIVAGQDSAPNPVEYLLHALASCLTAALVYHAAVHGIEIEAVDSSYTADIDVRGLFGLAEGVRKAPNKVTVDMRVKSEASPEQLTELAMHSPIHDLVATSLPVEFKLTTY